MSGVGQSEDGVEAGTSGMMETTMMEGEEYYNPDDSGTWTQKEMAEDQLCRICAKPNQYLIPIFEGEGIEHQLVPKIQKHLPIEVSETDDLPLQVCYQCASTLIAWNDLVIACIEADKKLRQIQEQEEEDDKGVEIFDEPIHDSDDGEEPDQPSTSIGTIVTDIPSDKTLHPKRSPGKAKKPKLKMTLVKSPMAGPSGLKSPVKKLTATKPQDSAVQEASERSPKVTTSATNGEKTQRKKKYKPKDGKVKLNDGHKCQKCGKVSSTKSSHNAHFTRMHSEEPKKCLCSMCGDGFHHPYQLRLHMMKHDGTMNFECNVCGKKFIDKTSIRKHSIIHLEDRPFSCKFCVWTFKRRNNLMDHELRIHGFLPEGYESHRCPVCGKVFHVSKHPTKNTASTSQVKFCSSACRQRPEKKSSDTKTMIKVERKPRTKRNPKFCPTSMLKANQPKKEKKSQPSQCQICGKIFKCIQYLKIHIKQVHDKDKFDKYCCNFCGKMFRLRICFDHHIRIHTNSKPCICKICNKAFRTSTCLARHRKIHQNLRQYQCKVCEKAFNQKTHLQTHFRIHSGSKPFSCGFCEKSFVYNTEKIKHENNVHKIKMEIE